MGSGYRKRAIRVIRGYKPALPMKKIAITILCACALLGASCSDSTVTTVVVTPTPVPELSAEQLAAIEKENKIQRERKEAANRPVEAAVVAAPTATPAP